MTTVEEESRAEVVVYNMEGHSTGIKMKIIIKIGSWIKNNKERIKELLTWPEFSKIMICRMLGSSLIIFRKRHRKVNQMILDSIAEFEKECLLEKAADFSETNLAFSLLETKNLTEMYETSYWLKEILKRRQWHNSSRIIQTELKKFPRDRKLLR